MARGFLLPLATISLLLLGACSGEILLAGDGQSDGPVLVHTPSAPDTTIADTVVPPPAPLQTLSASRVYAHDANALYRVDPDTLSVSLVGQFSWPDSPDVMTDLAIDRDGRMIGISFTTAYAIDPDTAAVTTLTQMGTTFNGLSFFPGADATAPERLVGVNHAGELLEINVTSGALTPIGQYGNGLTSSGDLVSVQNLGTFATVKVPSSYSDWLVRVDPTTGAAELIGDIGATNVWGLAFWGDRLYGFIEGGDFLLIDTRTGQGSVVDRDGVSWWGAAVTTSAPVLL